MKNEIIYSLSTEDIETILEKEEIRQLTETELKKVIEKIPEYIPWYESILEAINEIIQNQEQK
ncbi:MAG: hypothetical protein K9N09_10035 [Candidatus Cloacimonetes bacterium]|nr:hypothetical protein [Candidatus Cloacimonadota bacterium]MCF7814456.1 hypothetical protein [Candidatus Cloacimonadota bacterium]MCF7869031.1 hypothetical protein [Candidatus Cloacimonadota bacterium]MCF7884426.1 hypothetical protein [Candidatus Cloacimonadota bacterium]